MFLLHSGIDIKFNISIYLFAVFIPQCLGLANYQADSEMHAAEIRNQRPLVLVQFQRQAAQERLLLAQDKQHHYQYA